MAMLFGLIGAGLSALSSLMGSAQQASAQRMQAAQLQQQAAVMDANARLERERGRVEAEAIDAKKRDLRRDFMAQQGRNRSLLAAGNVDMASGSALDVSQGNIDLFADDMGENAYSKALRLWEAEQQGKNLDYQANAARSHANYLSKTAGNLANTLFTTALGGASGFMSGYGMGGGKLSNLFGGLFGNSAGAGGISALPQAFPATQNSVSPGLIDEIIKSGG